MKLVCCMALPALIGTAGAVSIAAEHAGIIPLSACPVNGPYEPSPLPHYERTQYQDRIAFMRSGLNWRDRMVCTGT